MGQKVADAVVMFADVVGSTRLYEQLGDTEAQRIVATCLNMARDICDAHHGDVKAELGDELMVVFSDAGDAAASACDIHARIPERMTIESPDRPITMRVGIHLGPLQENDTGSETVKIAQWAASNAKPEQTLATEAVIEKLPRIFQAVSRYVDDETWNFISIEHVTLHEIIWDVESVTAFTGEEPTMGAVRCKEVRFEYMGQSIRLTADRPVISVGRGEQNDLVVQNDLVSRQHFSAQLSRGRSTITDNSMNGTVIIHADGKTQPVKKETLPLLGKGQIVIGRPPKIDESYVIHYECS
ncbi:MAG: adenylate/guanylate cyclase domain-containing protein [Gammaproteobacteria bacterium]